MRTGLPLSWTVSLRSKSVASPSDSASRQERLNDRYVTYKPAKEAIAIIATPTKSVPAAIRVAEGVRATKTIKRPNRIGTSAKRKRVIRINLRLVGDRGRRASLRSAARRGCRKNAPRHGGERAKARGHRRGRTHTVRFLATKPRTACEQWLTIDAASTF
jgi:hypothetical protein